MKKLIATALGLAAIVMAPTMTAAVNAGEGSAFDFAFSSIDGKPMPLADWRGKVLLVVNTA